MRHQNNDGIVLEVDDEHPFFNTVWERSKASRSTPPVEALRAELRIGDTTQAFTLEDVSDVSWLDARAVMRTRWIPAGDPATVTTTSSTPTSSTPTTEGTTAP